jgi:hypothetical protein
LRYIVGMEIAVANETLADKINAALASGKTVFAYVYNGGSRFSPKWAGAFKMAKNGRDVVFINGAKKTHFFSCGTAWKVRG